MSKKPVVHYRVAVAVAAILSMALAEYIQRGPFPFPPALLAPIMIPLV